MVFLPRNLQYLSLGQDSKPSLTICSGIFHSLASSREILEELQDLTEDYWSIKREDIRDEHKLERAPNDLIVGWKAWIRDHGPNKGGMASRIERPADGLRTVVRDE
jgi:hypothetical protein